ncbi:hypothetical protein SDC9_46858 [bioreactor metagenome]|uniref:HTH cro/C1-type domain-containing protein n=1 Tax=bioreactor metagenome TaxID=1076179 RepID=A0A644WA09_9ZZZZ
MPFLQKNDMGRQGKDAERQLAEMLFTRDFLTQKEIAEKLGVAEKTVSKWAIKYKWKEKRQSVIVTKETQLKRVYDQIDELNTAILKRPEGERYANNKESDTLIKLANVAKTLESEASLAEVIDVSKRILNYVRSYRTDKAAELAAIFDDFINEQLKRHD